VQDTREDLLRFIGRTADPGVDVENVVQDVLYRAYRDWPNIRNPRQWAFTVAAHQLIADSKAYGHARPAALLPDQPLWSSAARITAPEVVAEANQVINTIHHLPRHQRIATYLQKVEGWPADEIATLLGTSVSTAYVHSSRGTRAVRTELSDGWCLHGDHPYRGGVGCLLMVLATAVSAVAAVMADYPRALLIILAIPGVVAMACIVFYSARFLRARLAERGRHKRNARQAPPARQKPPVLPQGTDDQAPT
jgi:DNA-directed RNA polymerase specialized sigma24 family protein